MYTVSLATTEGKPIVGLLPYTNLSVALTLNDVSRIKVVIAINEEIWRAIPLDALLLVWRETAGAALFVGAFYIREKTRGIDERGNEYISLYAECPMTLLSRRHVLYPAGSSQSKKSGPADDIIKEIVRENLGTSASAERRIPNLVVEQDTSEGATVSKSFAWRNVLTACQDIAAASAGQGVPVYFALRRRFDGALEFFTRAGLFGTDRRTRVAPFSVQAGSLSAPVRITYDATSAATYVLAAGRGEGALRETVEASLDNVDPLRRIEYFCDVRDASGDTLASEAIEALHERKVRRIFEAVLVDTPGAQYKHDWDLGDLVSLEYAAEVIDCVVAGVAISVTPTQEIVRAKLINEQ